MTRESTARRMFTLANGGTYEAFASLDDARREPDGAVVLEGDYGGQIYVTAPARLVACDEATLERLLRDLDAIAWQHNSPDAAAVYFERHPVGAGVAGGMGGAAVMEGIWIHEEFVKLGLDEEIRAVVRGERDHITKPGGP
jgi:hypothetical protein